MTMEMSHSLFINICRTNAAGLRKNFIAIWKNDGNSSMNFITDNVKVLLRIVIAINPFVLKHNYFVSTLVFDEQVVYVKYGY